MTIRVEVSTEGKGSITRRFTDPERAIEAIRVESLKEHVERHGGSGLCGVLIFPTDPGAGGPSAA